MTSRRIFTISLLSVLFLGVGNVSSDGSEIFMKINGITGGSTDSGHAGWIAVESLSHGVSRAVSISTGTTQASQGQMNATLVLDQSSPYLFNSICGQKQPISDVEIEFDRTSPTTVQFYKITLNNVYLSQVDISAASGDNSPPTQNISLAYEQITWSYTQVDTAGQPATTAMWNVPKNTGTNGVTQSDSDYDGLPDSWEMAYFGTLTNSASDDSDHDGLSNYQEFIAGTNPNDPNSVLRVTGINLANGGVNLTWSSVAGKTYTIYGAANVEGPYTPVFTTTANSTGETSTNFPPSGFHFYRVAVP